MLTENGSDDAECSRKVTGATKSLVHAKGLSLECDEFCIRVSCY